MIRRLQPRELQRVLEIWLNGNLDAHGFVSQAYWLDHLPALGDQLLQAQVYVLEEASVVQGFVGLQGNYLAGIFVERQARARGIGKMLLDHVKGFHDTLWLHVYQQNRGAVAFYLREGFSIAAQGVDEDTGQPEYTMTWPASEN